MVQTNRRRNDAFAVGRDKGNDIIIRDLHSSSQRAWFTVRHDGVFENTGLGSSCGTVINGVHGTH